MASAMSAGCRRAPITKLNIERANAMSVRKHIPIGTRFARLVVVGQSEPYIIPKSGCAQTKSLCLCDCGNKTAVRDVCLRNGSTRSCGCMVKNNKHNFKHGQLGTPTYRTWAGMIQRCHDPNSSSFERYGGIGIRVCKRWHDFRNFLSDMGARPSGMSIERIKNELGYSKHNCKWATRTEQNRNTRRNHRITHNGLTLTISAWAEKTGIKPHTILGRIRAGKTPARALTDPVQPWRKPRVLAQKRPLSDPINRKPLDKV